MGNWILWIHLKEAKLLNCYTILSLTRVSNFNMTTTNALSPFPLHPPKQASIIDIFQRPRRSPTANPTQYARKNSKDCQNRYYCKERSNRSGRIMPRTIWYWFISIRHCLILLLLLVLGQRSWSSCHWILFEITTYIPFGETQVYVYIYIWKFFVIQKC